MNTLKDVKEFHLTFGHPVLDTPQIPSKDRCKLRVSLISEELRELQEGIDNKDIVEIADALCDIQYVLSGAILEFGLADKFPALFAEVQRSNMSKACKDLKEVSDTMKHHYEMGNGNEFKYEERKENVLVVTRNDGKLMKSINYSPADLKSIIDGK